MSRYMPKHTHLLPQSTLQPLSRPLLLSVEPSTCVVVIPRLLTWHAALPGRIQAKSHAEISTSVRERLVQWPGPTNV